MTSCGTSRVCLATVFVWTFAVLKKFLLALFFARFCTIRMRQGQATKLKAKNKEEGGRQGVVTKKLQCAVATLELFLPCGAADTIVSGYTLPIDVVYVVL